MSELGQRAFEAIERSMFTDNLFHYDGQERLSFQFIRAAEATSMRITFLQTTNLKKVFHYEIKFF